MNNQSALITEQQKILKEIKKIRDDIRALDEHNDYRFYSLYKKNGEDLLTAKKRFFFGISQTDKYMSLKQKGNLIILKEFVKICNENKIEYSVAGGSLLGAIRHNGFIPWDDDVDICMPYEEFIKVKTIFKNHPIFEIVDWYMPKIPFRIRKIVFKEHKNIWYLDIFPFEKFSIKSELAIKENLILKNKLRENILASIPDISDYIFSYSCDPCTLKKLEMQFEKTRQEYTLMINKTDDFQGYIRSIEIPNDGPYVILKDDFYPLLKHKFEQIEVNVMNNYLGHIEDQYGNYMSLPFDLFTHIHDKSQVSSKTIDVENKFLDLIIKRLKA